MIHIYDIIDGLECVILQFVRSLASLQRLTLIDLRKAYIASVSHNLLRSGLTITKRDVYYQCRLLFPNPEVVDNVLSLLGRLLSVCTNDLNIIPAPKGIVTGPLSYIDEHKNQVNVALFGPNGTLIPSRPERLEQLSTSAQLILVYVFYRFE